MDVRITTQEGDSIDLEDAGIIVKDFDVSSIEVESEYEKVEGSDGNVDYGATLGSRTITVPFAFKAYDLLDYPLLRDKLFRIVTSKQSFYISELRREVFFTYGFVDTNESPTLKNEAENRLVNGKRYLVRLSNQFNLEQTNVWGEGELVFETTQLPYSESVGTSQDIHKNGIDSNSHLWAFGMGLLDEDDLKYNHTVTSNNNIDIYNAGNVTIHPFEHLLEIDISNVRGSSEHFALVNETNGTEFRTKEGINSDAIIRIGRGTVTNNGSQYLRETTKEFIVLSPGNNKFSISGAVAADVSFNFKFYYK